MGLEEEVRCEERAVEGLRNALYNRGWQKNCEGTEKLCKPALALDCCSLSLQAKLFEYLQATQGQMRVGAHRAGEWMRRDRKDACLSEDFL
eukprot:1159332-Pelagomonas_calceolata.AAC.6